MLQSYVQEIAALLLHDNPSPEVQASLNQLASETSVLIGIIKSLNPQAFSIFNQADSAQEGNPGLDRIFYCRLAVCTSASTLPETSVHYVLTCAIPARV